MLGQRGAKYPDPRTTDCHFRFLNRNRSGCLIQGWVWSYLGVQIKFLYITGRLTNFKILFGCEGWVVLVIIYEGGIIHGLIVFVGHRRYTIVVRYGRLNC
ncbi:hypothetical protein BDN67DRAFT_455393 [Paxillus ammoniavirescens]|nr:hypothetical protein BDN67DRAFT_455393 [Paxillus ammoniavirescens]